MAKRRQSKGEELAELITTIQAKYDLSALRALLSSNRQVEAILLNAVNKFAQIGEKTRFNDSEAEFLLKNYPAVKKQVDDALTALHNSLVTAIQSNCEDAWALAEAKNDEIVDAIAKRTKLSLEQVERWKARNAEAAAEFFKRTDRNFNLSRNIWELADEFKGEMELALDIGLGEGRSAASLAKEMQKYLKDPDKLFRRVRDKHGNLKLSKNAAAYHPGRGKYRSAYKNALRVTGTEGNIAYRTADYERWQQLDFVEGIEINTSHTNHPVADICDELKGVYPKEFKWTGWHPMCRCNATAKMSDFDAFLAKQQEYIDNGTQPDYSDSKVTEMPENFTKWVNDNESRIANATSLPYFLADNGKLSKGKYRVQLGANQNSNKEDALSNQNADNKRKHRTKEEIDKIQEEWNVRKLLNANIDILDLNLFDDDEYQKLLFAAEEAISNNKQKDFKRLYNKIKERIAEARDKEYLNTEKLMQSSDFAQNNADLEKIFGKRGIAMTFKQANEMRSNPHYFDDKTYQVNCQTCVVANEMRRRGFNVEALANTKGSALEKLSKNMVSAWLDSNNNHPQFNVAGYILKPQKLPSGNTLLTWEQVSKTRKHLVKTLESDITEDGRYHIMWNWSNKKDGHIITAERIDGKYRYYDPQNGIIIDDFVAYLKNMRVKDGIYWLRVDNLRINTDVAKKVLTKAT